MTGPAHLAQGMPGQDALQVRGWRGGWIVAVADGLGSRLHGATGARLAVQVAQQTVRGWPACRGAWLDVPAREVAAEIHRRWLAAVPWSDKGSAATTLLLLACDAAGRARYWQLGDGLVLVRSEGQLRVLTPPRAGFGNQTRALGVDRTWSAWHSGAFTLQAPGDMALLMTDGVADDLEPPVLAGFAQAVHSTLRCHSRRSGRRWLAHELTHWATPLHADDKTLAAVFKDKHS